MPRKPLEVRLDSKRYRSRKREERRSVGMRWYDACREVPTLAIRHALASLRVEWARRTRHAQTRAAQKESARLAFSCSNPDRGEHATSNALNCSIASPVLCLPRQSSQMHARQAQDQPPRQELA